MRLLLTGATGFLGRNLLIQVLRDRTYEKIFLPVRSRKKLEMQLAAEGFAKVPADLKIFEGDCEQWNLPPAAKQAEHVVHSAGVIFEQDWDSYRRTNVEGTLSLVRELVAPERVVILSSLSAAGPCQAPAETLAEGCVDRPLTWYGKSKLEMEHRLRTEFKQLPYICLRPPMVFGPRDHATLPLFKMVRKRVFFKPSFQDKRYSVIASDDLVRAILSALRALGDWQRSNPAGDQRYFFIAHSQTISDRDILHTAAAVVGAWGIVVPVPQFLLRIASRLISSIPTWRATIPTLSVDRAREIWPSRWVISSEKFTATFGWHASTSFREAVQQTYDWYVQFGLIPSVNRRWQQVTPSISPPKHR